jgi:hypothetical protein
MLSEISLTKAHEHIIKQLTFRAFYGCAILKINSYGCYSPVKSKKKL